MRSSEGISRPRRSSSIIFSFTQDPSQDPLGKGAKVTPTPDAAPLPFCRATFRAILVWIWMNGMAAAEEQNPNRVRQRLQTKGIRSSEQAKKEKTRASGNPHPRTVPLFKRGRLTRGDRLRTSPALDDMSQTYLQFLMLHACFTPISLCFIYTAWHFYAFSGANLLTRCHGASSLFSAVFVFQKVTHEIFLELDKMKADVPIYLTRRRIPEERRRWTKGQPHHRWCDHR
jgi:hypothetical protein